MAKIVNVTSAFPPYKSSQEEILKTVSTLWKDQVSNLKRIQTFFKNVEVVERYHSLPLEQYGTLTGFGKRNEVWLETALSLGEQAISQMLDETGLDLDSVGLFASTTITGLSVPSLEARLMNKFPFKNQTKRLPLFGLGCLAGVAGINRVCEYLNQYPKEAALFLSVELCSLTAQIQDFSVANMVSTGLFGDGSALVLMVGDEHPLASKGRLEWIRPRSSFFPNTERIMGWDMVDSGFKIVLSAKVDSMVKENVPSELNALLEEANLTREDLKFFVAHPGGPKVLMAMEEALGLGKGDLFQSWKSLEVLGNLSSSSVLLILKETLKDLAPNLNGLMIAMGPAFCSEMTLVRSL